MTFRRCIARSPLSAVRSTIVMAAITASTASTAMEASAVESIVMCNGEAVTHRRAEVMCDESAVLRNYEMIVTPSAMIPTVVVPIPIVMPVIVIVVDRIPPSAPVAPSRVVSARVHGTWRAAISVSAWVNVVASRESKRCDEQYRQR